MNAETVLLWSCVGVLLAGVIYLWLSWMAEHAPFEDFDVPPNSPPH